MPQEFGVAISYRNLIFGVIPQSDNQVDLTGLHHLVQALIERHCKETVTVYFIFFFFRTFSLTFILTITIYILAKS